MENRNLKITMEMTEDQARLLLRMCEEFCRLRILQPEMLVEDLVWDGDKYGSLGDDASDRDKTDELFKKEGIVFSVFKSAFDIFNIIYNDGRQSFHLKSQQYKNAEDVWIAIRKAFYVATTSPEVLEETPWDVWSNDPLGFGEYPVPKVEVEIIKHEAIQ